MKRKEILIPHNIYHIYNRGVEKRKIFLKKEDYFRFIHNLFEFNDEEPALNIYYKKQFFKNQSYEAGPRKIKRERKTRKLLVKILAFCLMPNHFHLFLEEIKEGGITRFMQKLGTGYSMYFNKKYERPGGLFQGRFKSVVVKNDAHFLHLSYYIHCNPLDLITPEWREKQIKNYKRAMRFLNDYRWSSFLDYIGKKNFPSVTQREFLMKFFGGPAQYRKDTVKWLKELEDWENITRLTLE